MAYSPYCIEGFDKLGVIGDLAYRGHWSLVTNDLVLNTSAGRNGLGCLVHSTTGSTAKRSRRITMQNRGDSVAGSLQTVKVGIAVAFNFSSQPSTSNVYPIVSFWDATPALMGYIRMDFNSGNWRIGYGVGGTPAYSITLGPTLTSGRWYHIEFECSDFRNTGGSGTVSWISVDGVTPVGSSAATSAQSGSSQNLRHIDINAQATSVSLASGESIYYDDFHCGSIGAVGTISTPASNQIGNTRCDVLRPDGDGNYNSQFTPSAGSRYQTVDDPDTPNGDTDYSSSGTLDDRLSVTVEDLPHSPATIFGIAPHHVAARSGAGSRSSRSFIRVSGTDYEGATTWDVSHGTTYQGCWMTPSDADCITNPATGVAYTKTDLQSIEIGVRVSA